MSFQEPPGHVKHVQMSRSAPPDGTCLHLLKPAQISRSPRDVLPLAQTSSDQLSLAQIHSDSSAASRKHVNNICHIYHDIDDNKNKNNNKDIIIHNNNVNDENRDDDNGLQ